MLTSIWVEAKFFNRCSVGNEIFLFVGETGKQAVSKKHVLVMDEVDGMAGNEDRGKFKSLKGNKKFDCEQE